MSVWGLVVLVLLLAVLVVIARLRFGLAKPAWLLTGLGVLGAVMVLFGLGGEAEHPAYDSMFTPVSIIGTMLSFVAFLGLLALILIWAIRKWGLPTEPEGYE